VAKAIVWLWLNP